jgi:Oxygen-sensitive ribonucleoside-triphosphate reductase
MNGLWLGSEKLDENDSIEAVINQGTLSIGFIGLAECLIALVGKHHGESEEAQELGLRIISHMAEKINGFAETYQHNFTFLATPAEGLSGKFTKRDKKIFGILPGQSRTRTTTRTPATSRVLQVHSGATRRRSRARTTSTRTPATSSTWRSTATPPTTRRRS